MDSKKVKLQGYGNSKLWQENDFNNKKKTMQTSWARDKERSSGKCGYFGKNSMSQVTWKTTGKTARKFKRLIQRKKSLPRVMQELSWQPMSFDMAQEEEQVFCSTPLLKKQRVHLTKLSRK